jgi:two-component system sensor histidine kinase KdpD
MSASPPTANAPVDAAPGAPARWPALATWALAWLAMAALDGRLDVANLALILVLAAAVAALWWPPLASTAANAAAVLAFNVAFVPPRGVLDVELREHALLLATMLAVSTIVALLVARQRRLAATERELAARAGRLHAFGDALRDVDDPATCAPRLRELLAASSSGASVALRWRDASADPYAAAPTRIADDVPGGPGLARLGEATPDEEDGLHATLASSRALGAGTERRSGLRATWLPMRGRGASQGAVVIRWADADAVAPGLIEHLQSLCDAMGLALERADAVRAAARAREASQAQALRGTLLAAIAHDHRTPLATILGAATSLREQADRLDDASRRRLAGTIVDEAAQLARVVDNTLQLARLDSPGVALALDWESIEELVGAAAARARRRDLSWRVRTRVEPGLPLLRVDATLVTQLLDNLLTNARLHGAGDEPVELEARRAGDAVAVVVRDRGPGLPASVLARGDGAPASMGAVPDGARPGVGLGLAVCRAIARVHGGTFALRERPGGGTEAECLLPVAAPPAPPVPEAAG